MQKYRHHIIPAIPYTGYITYNVFEVGDRVFVEVYAGYFFRLPIF